MFVFLIFLHISIYGDSTNVISQRFTYEKRRVFSLNDKYFRGVFLVMYVPQARISKRNIFVNIDICIVYHLNDQGFQSLVSL